MMVSLLMAMGLMIVGAVLISPINTAVQEVATATTTVTPTPSPLADYVSATATPETLSSAVGSLSAIIPLLFVIIIILGVFKSFDSFGTPEKREVTRQKVRKMLKNSREFVLRIETSSKKYQKFVQNLDELFHLTSITVERPDKALQLRSADNGEHELIISEEYDWYIADKHPSEYMFKVVGLHKKDSEKNVVYVLGLNKELDKPFLIQFGNFMTEYSFTQLSDTDEWARHPELVKN